MKKLYGKTLDLEIYKDEIPVFYGSKELMIEWFKQNYPNNDEALKDISASAGFCYTDKPNDCCVPDFIYIGKNKKNHGTIAHEVLHYAMFLLSDRSVGINPENQEGHEALTYLVGYIVSQIQNTNFSVYDFKKKKWIKQ